MPGFQGRWKGLLENIKGSSQEDPSTPEDLYPSVSPKEAEILKKSRRRGVLRFLSDEEPSETAYNIPDIARQVASWENQTGIEDLEDKDYDTVYATLHGTHLPN